MKSTNHITAGNPLVTAPAYGATQALDWNLYDCAYLTPAEDTMNGSLTITCSNKSPGQVFDLFINVDITIMSMSITWPTNVAPSGTAYVNTSGGTGVYHYRLTWINSVLHIELVASGHS